MANSHILVGASANPLQPVVRRISTSDLYYALARGYDDFAAFPSHALFLCVIYPLLGILLIGLTSGTLSLLPLAVPIAAGFALVGPVAAIGLYELSRRREAGLDSSLSHVFDVLHSPSLGAIIALSVLLMAIFLIWLVVAQALYIVIFGYSAPASIEQFITDLLTTPRGSRLHHCPLGDRVFVRRACAVHQRDLIPAAARPRCRRGGRDAHLASRDGGESAADGAVGIDCRRALGDRLDPVLRWAHGGDAAARTCDLAPVSAYGRTGWQSAPGLPAARASAPFGRRFPCRAVADPLVVVIAL